MAVPETTVNENNGLPLWQDDIRFTGELLFVETETIAEPMEDRTNLQFWCRILGTNAAHIPAAARFAESIHRSCAIQVEIVCDNTRELPS